MWERGSACRGLLVWCVVGVVLDTAALIALWLLLNAIGPLNHAAEAWLAALALIAVPWLVHVIALPVIFRVAPKNWSGIAQLVAMTLLFIPVAGILFPLLGLMLFIFGSLVFGLLKLLYMTATGLTPRVPFGPPTWVDQLLSYVVWTIIAMIVAAPVGLLLHGMSADTTSRTLRPSPSTDVLGAVVAAFLAFSGMFAASTLGLFRRELPNDHFHSIPPQLPATLVIGVIALLPHLILVGLDLIGCDVIQQQGAIAAGPNNRSSHSSSTNV